MNEEEEVEDNERGNRIQLQIKQVRKKGWSEREREVLRQEKL